MKQDKIKPTHFKMNRFKNFRMNLLQELQRIKKFPPFHNLNLISAYK